MVLPLCEAEPSLVEALVGADVPMPLSVSEPAVVGANVVLLLLCETEPSVVGAFLGADVPMPLPCV